MRTGVWGAKPTLFVNSHCFFFLFQLFLVQNQFNDDVIINKIAKTQDLVHEICNRGIIFQNHMPTHHIFSLKIHGSLKIYIYFQFRVSLKLKKGFDVVFRHAVTISVTKLFFLLLLYCFSVKPVQCVV